MLKIKDDVDLKELEKFGFNYEELDETQEGDTEPYIIKQYSNYDDAICPYTINIDIKTRIINDTYSYPGYAEIVPADLIFDLIQAGLVEKVVE